MRTFVDFIELCREHLGEKDLKISRSCYINCLGIRSIRGGEYGENREPGFIVDSHFFYAKSKKDADICIKRVIDVVTEIQEDHQMEHIDITNRRIAQTLKSVIKEEREILDGGKNT